MGAVAGAVNPPGGLCVGFRRGRPTPADQREEQPPSDRWSRKRVRQRRRRHVPLPNGTELRVYVIQSTMALTIAGSSFTSGLMVRLSTRRTMTMRVAGDDASVAWELLRVVSGLRCELVEPDLCRELLMGGVRNTVGLPARGDGERRTPNVAEHGHDLDRLRSACCWSRLLRSSQRRAGAGRLRNDQMIR